MPFVYTNRTGVGLNTGFASSGPGSSGSTPTPVLLPDLVFGAALTAGPQQTLSSAGVVASGPLDLTANGSPTFGANGVVLNGIDQSVSHVNTSSLQTGGDFFVNLVLKLTSLDDGFTALVVGKPTDGGIDEWTLLAFNDGGTYSLLFSTVLGGNSAQKVISLNTNYVVSVWSVGGVLNMQLDVGAPDTISSGGVQQLSTDPFTIGGTDGSGWFAGTIKNVYFAKTDISAWIAAKDWLGVGRTGAEVAAYTG